MENPDLVFQETGDSSPTHSRRLNVLADKLCNLTQTRQSRQNGPSCQSFSKQYASGGTSPKWACFCHLAQQQTVSTCITGARSPSMDNDTVSLPWEDLDPYAFPLVAILGKWWRSCRTTHAGESLCFQVAQHAWFWDLLIMSSQIPWYLFNLLSQPFNQTPHRNLSKLDLHTWLLEPQQSRSRASLRQWQ